MKDLRCFISWHHWIKVPFPDGSGVYLECGRCGKVEEALNREGPSRAPFLAP